MTKERAETQDIRALKIAILNLMPTKQETEAQLLRLIGNTPLQLDVHLLHMESHLSRNVAQEHLTSFYKHSVILRMRNLMDSLLQEHQLKPFLLKR